MDGGACSGTQEASRRKRRRWRCGIWVRAGAVARTTSERLPEQRRDAPAFRAAVAERLHEGAVAEQGVVAQNQLSRESRHMQGRAHANRGTTTDATKSAGVRACRSEPLAPPSKKVLERPCASVADRKWGAGAARCMLVRVHLDSKRSSYG
eukprot:2328257-Pleurochrysis_carterae.AAC.2